MAVVNAALNAVHDPAVNVVPHVAAPAALPLQAPVHWSFVDPSRP